MAPRPRPFRASRSPWWAATAIRRLPRRASSRRRPYRIGSPTRNWPVFSSRRSSARRRPPAPLAALTALEPVVVPELREVYLGDWEGGELRIRAAHGDPILKRAQAEERWDVIPNAEPMEAFAERVAAGLETIVDATGPGALAAAFVHGGVIGELCRQATGSRPFAFLHADNASITRLVVLGDGRRLLRCFNDTAHLAAVHGYARSTPIRSSRPSISTTEPASGSAPS